MTIVNVEVSVIGPDTRLKRIRFGMTNLRIKCYLRRRVRPRADGAGADSARREVLRYLFQIA